MFYTSLDNPCLCTRPHVSKVKKNKGNRSHDLPRKSLGQYGGTNLGDKPNIDSTRVLQHYVPIVADSTHTKVQDKGSRIRNY
jgi:hypothetical protein